MFIPAQTRDYRSDQREVKLKSTGELTCRPMLGVEAIFQKGWFSAVDKVS
jgi:hypothetical protein